MRGPNMSYCMWENTSKALDQCIQGLQEAEEEDSIEEYVANLSDDEKRGLRSVLRSVGNFTGSSRIRTALIPK